MAAVPSRGRANHLEGPLAPEAEATRALYERYANQVFRYCLHQLGSREEAEDAVQSTFLNAFRGIRRGVVPELEAAWLFKVAHNVCLSRRRSAWRRGRIESPADFGAIEELTPAPSRRADELIGLQEVLERLPEGQRRAILLREWQGLSYREIAAELELSQSAVETLIFRARRSLAKGLSEAPVAKRRVARVFDWGNAVAALKAALLGGSVAAKAAVTIAVVSATVVAAAPTQRLMQVAASAPVKAHRHVRATAHTRAHVQHPSVVAVVVSRAPAVHVARTHAVLHAVVRRRHAPPAAAAPVEPRAQAPESGQPAAAPVLPVPVAPSRTDGGHGKEDGGRAGGDEHGRGGHRQEGGNDTVASGSAKPVEPDSSTSPVTAADPATAESNGDSKGGANGSDGGGDGRPKDGGGGSNDGGNPSQHGGDG
jgi:RNA polymerase sigma factor (sigma-70 family)